MKFGGTSLGTPQALRQAAQIVAQASAEQSVVVVVSAFAGVTDDIARQLGAAAHGDAAAVEQGCARLRERSFDLAQALLAGNELPSAQRAAEQACARLQEICGGILQLRAQTPEIADLALALGEEIVAELFAACLRQLHVAATAVDARNV